MARGRFERVDRLSLILATAALTAVAAGCASTPAPPSASLPSAVPPSAVPPSAVTAPVVDPALLQVLPAAVDGRPVVETPDAELSTVADPSIARAVEGLALAYVTSDGGADWAIASVARLRPGTWNDAFWRDWRDTYDAGVCAPQGGVAGNASATIAGRTVDIATCGPLRTYHVHLAGRDVVVSLTSLGERRYGERIVRGLRP